MIAERIEDIRKFMYRNHKIIVVMPAYNAAKTIRKTYNVVMEKRGSLIGSSDPRGLRKP